jgi:hypothetical protein
VPGRAGLAARQMTACTIPTMQGHHAPSAAPCHKHTRLQAARGQVVPRAWRASPQCFFDRGWVGYPLKRPRQKGLVKRDNLTKQARTARGQRSWLCAPPRPIAEAGAGAHGQVLHPKGQQRRAASSSAAKRSGASCPTNEAVPAPAERRTQTCWSVQAGQEVQHPPPCVQAPDGRPDSTQGVAMCKKECRKTYLAAGQGGGPHLCLGPFEGRACIPG